MENTIAPSNEIVDIIIDIPKPVMSTSSRDITILDAVKRFHARKSEYKEAGFTDEQIEQAWHRTQYHIPDHQRFYVWTLEMQRLLIDSVFRNLPMPDFLVSEIKDSLRVSVEDGQQRLTTLWRFVHNLFAYVTPGGVHIYYSEVPEGAPSSSATLEVDDPDAFRHFNQYRLHFTEYRFSDGLGEEDRQGIIAEGFERRNSGKPLTDGDKFWNRKNTSVVKCALVMGQAEQIQPLLKEALNIDIRNIGAKKTKSKLCTLVGLVLGLYGDTTSPTWADVLTTSFTKLASRLEPEFDPHYGTVHTGVSAICNAIIEGMAGQDNTPGLRKKDNASFQRHLGLMVYDWRMRHALNHVEENSSDDAVVRLSIHNDITGKFHRFWSNIIRHFASQDYTMDDLEHPITQLYVDGDRKNKNTDIGKNIAQRHAQLMKIVGTWGIQFE